MILLRSRLNLLSRNSEPLSFDRAYQYALRLLTGRDYSVAGIRQKLAGREVAGSDLDAVILRLQHEGWLDDARYAVRSIKPVRLFWRKVMRFPRSGRRQSAATPDIVIQRRATGTNAG